jgi:hypothetical protein
VARTGDGEHRCRWRCSGGGSTSWSMFGEMDAVGWWRWLCRGIFVNMLTGRAGGRVLFFVKEPHFRLRGVVLIIFVVDRHCLTYEISNVSEQGIK